MEVTTIVFDFAGTLATKGPNRDPQVLVDLMQTEFGTQVPPEFLGVLSFRLSQDSKAARLSGVEHRIEDTLRHFFLECRVPRIPQVHAVVDRFHRHIGDGQVYPEAIVLLRHIFKMGLRLILASNTPRSSSVRLATLRNVGIDQFFHDVILSSEVGFRKPHPRFFDAVVKSSGSSKKNIIFIGDSLTKDILPAERAGMSTIWVDRLRENHAYPHVGVNFLGKVDTLREVPNLLSMCKIKSWKEASCGQTRTRIWR